MQPPNPLLFALCACYHRARCYTLLTEAIKHPGIAASIVAEAEAEADRWLAQHNNALYYTPT
jgi:hypothetical protein